LIGARLASKRRGALKVVLRLSLSPWQESNMTESIALARLYQRRSRRETLSLLGAGAVMLGIAPDPALGQSGSETVLTEALVLRDPDIPVAGNADGDITIVEYFDYQCPYCRKIEPELRQVVQDDGKVRFVLKDWPILGPVSVIAARMTLASKYQEKYIQAHEALIGVNSKLTEPR
jgi:protein-disulfide isomerase